MKAVIHIGTPKSGTTTIQSFLSLNRTALQDQGIRYQPFDPRNIAQLELGLAGLVGVGEMAGAANKKHALGAHTRAEQEAYVARFDAMLAEGVNSWPEGVYLGSSEQVHSWLSTRPRVQALHDFLKRHFESVHYIVYYRPQEEFMLSTYSERIKRGEILTFDEHYQQRLEAMDFHRKAKIWTRVAGRENLTVRLLDRTELKNGDLLDDFCAAAGIDRGPLQDPPRMNVSLSAEEIDLYLKLGRRIPARRSNGGPNPVFFGLLKLMKMRLPNPGSRLRLSQAQIAEIRALNAESNERLRADFFPERETLFSQR
ncbi:hypothetical protein [Pararhodobacter sp. CCB-MM2]|uniref:hypothetical protein n=1 Tax=Pararhodobacter sp. CCB-MM2 TaxID=1786003 RepID=UPI00082BC629|nr:hypothetical protein [Pararhodobacter sp. CCB-MM2]